MDDRTEPCFTTRCLNIIAVRRKDFIVVVKSNDHRIAPEIWIYNLWTEQLKKCQPLKENGLPSKPNLVGVEIRSVIYIFNAYSFQHMWKLIPLRDDLFQESKISVFAATDKLPSPREDSCVWKYGDKIWIFGGFGRWYLGHNFIDTYGDFEMCASHGYNNQLFACSPFIDKWTNVECSGRCSLTSIKSFHSNYQRQSMVVWWRN